MQNSVQYQLTLHLQAVREVIQLRPNTRFLYPSDVYRGMFI